MDDERTEELGSLTAIFPELIIDPTNEFSSTLEIPVTPTTPLLVRFLPTDPFENDTYAGAAVTAAHIERDARLTQLPPLNLHLTLPDSYPADAPPTVRLTTQYDWLPQEKVAELEAEIANLWEEYGHCQVLFAYIDFLQQAAERGFDLHQTAGGCLVLPSSQESKLVAFAERKGQETFNKGTYDCGICLEPKKGSACYRMKHCGHVFCRQCLQDFYNDAITEGNVDGVQCLDPDCGMTDANGNRRRQKKLRLVHPTELLAMGIEDRMVRRYVEMKRKKKLETDRNTVYCPRQWCTGPAKNPRYPPIPADLSKYVDMDDDASEGSPPRIEAALDALGLPDRLAVCEKCSFAFCRICYHGWHGPYQRCNPRNPDELSAEEKASYEYLQQQTSPCPECQAPTSKTHGCNHMKCGNCRAHFCYLCSAWLNADNPYQHFNTEGTECYQRLWELEEGDNGQAPRDGRGFGGARGAEQQAHDGFAFAEGQRQQLEAEDAAARAQVEQNGNLMPDFPAAPEPPNNDIPIIVALAQFDFVDDLDAEEPAPRNPPPRGGPRQRNPFPRNPPAPGAALAVRNHERGRDGGGARQRGGENRQQLEQRQREQAELQRFLAMAQRDEEEGWDSDDLGDDDDDFVIPRR